MEITLCKGWENDEIVLLIERLSTSLMPGPPPKPLSSDSAPIVSSFCHANVYVAVEPVREPLGYSHLQARCTRYLPPAPSVR